MGTDSVLLLLQMSFKQPDGELLSDARVGDFPQQVKGLLSQCLRSGTAVSKGKTNIFQCFRSILVFFLSSDMHVYLLFYPSRLFWCELPTSGQHAAG